MYQLFAVVISFLFIPILSKLKFKLSYTLLITAGILSVLSGVGIQSLGDSILSVVLDKSSLATILTVVMVTILSGLMKEYGILDKVVESMVLVVRNKKMILMIIPAMIGMLIVPGGALLSAPFINNLGEEMKIPPSRRAAINLVFRHISMFFLPYSTSLLIIAGIMPEVSIPRIILLNMIFVISMTVIGYYMYIRDIEIETQVYYERNEMGKYILKLITYTSPIYVSVLINAVTGLPFYISLIGSILLVYVLSDKKNFIRNLIRSFNYQTILTVAAIFILKDLILKMDGLLSVFNSLFLNSNSIYTTMIIFLISCYFFGFITGFNSASLAIILPIVSQLNLSNELLHIFVYFAYGCGFLGYFFSPLHLCQAFTVQHVGTTTKELYKEYKYLAPLLLIVLVISFLILV